MASERQIRANRNNALKSTGPRSQAGKQRSKQNAIKHGLAAATVVTSIESLAIYQTFEQAILDDYKPRTLLGHQLVSRIAALFWRLRRSGAIETGLFEIQGTNLHQQRRLDVAVESQSGLGVFYRLLRNPPVCDEGQSPSDASQPVAVEQSNGAGPCAPTDAAAIYLRLCHHHDATLDRLARYEASLWRQLTQSLVALDIAESSSDGVKPLWRK